MRCLFSPVQLPLERRLRVEIPVPYMRKFRSSTINHSSMHEISHRFVLHCLLVGLVGIRLPVPIHLVKLHGRLRTCGWHLPIAMRKVRPACPTCSSFPRDRRQRTAPVNPSVKTEACRCPPCCVASSPPLRTTLLPDPHLWLNGRNPPSLSRFRSVASRATRASLVGSMAVPRLQHLGVHHTGSLAESLEPFLDGSRRSRTTPPRIAQPG